ncbi:MAG: hypothetical protein RLZZ476_2121 [Verrucomicrobiota bacterium]|jgi:hypothetical protein
MKTCRPKIPQMRRKPSNGTIIRMPLQDGTYAYALIVFSTRAWVYDFTTQKPACGDSFFTRDRIRFASLLGDCAINFVDCGKMRKSEFEKIPDAEFYTILHEDMQEELGFKTPNAVMEGSGYLPYREVSKQEIKEKGLWPDEWLEWHSVDDLIRRWRKRMNVREVPEEHVDHAALAAASQPMEEEPPQEVELLILMPLAELRTDDPEPDLEEPLAGYLTEFECGEVTGSGTTPGFFEINVETTQEDLPRCLNLTRRTLKHLKAPASTIIRVLSDPPVDHPLNPLKKTGVSNSVLSLPPFDTGLTAPRRGSRGRGSRGRGGG